MRIVVPELDNLIVQEAVREYSDVEFLPAADLDMGAEMLGRGEADTMLSGIDFPSRDVVIACKNHLPLKSQYFSSSFICKKGDLVYALADGGVNKMPNEEQLYCIVEDTAITFLAYTGEQPRIAMLSYSTNGSGGKNPDLEKIHFVIDKIRENHRDWLIDGEMQLDAAIDPLISAKKFPESVIRGEANILITPDLNSGNIMYKTMERFGGFEVAGPIIQGFEMPVADLSRGSTVEDVKITIDVIKKLYERSHDG